MVPGWWRVFVYSGVAYIPLFLFAIWLGSTRAAILGFVAALAVGMTFNVVVPGTARKAPKVVAKKVPKIR